MLNITTVPSIKVPLTDPNSQLVTTQWYRYFYNLTEATGAATGVIPTNRGGTGQTTYTNGQILIGNSITGSLNKTTLTAGAAITITNGPGSITISGNGVTSLTAGVGIGITDTTGDITISNTGVLSFSAGFTGLTPATNTTGAVTLGGILNVANGGTGQNSYTDGQLLIGNSLGNTLTKATLTAGQNIGVTNGNGSIEVAFSGILPVVNGGTGADNAADARTNLEAAKSGANSDITSMSGLTGGITTPDYITFDITPETVPTAPGSLYWDSADGNQTLSLIMANSDAVQQIGEEIYYRIKASAAITEGQLIMFTGTVGASGALKGAPATGLTASTASYIMGVATHDIANNAWGYVTAFGLVRGINTTGGAEAWVDGQILYYNPAVAGGLTKTVPSAPNAKVQVCAVINAASGGSGSLFIRPSFGGILGQYEGDVGFTSTAAYDLIQRNAANTAWVNVPVSSIIGSGSAPVTKTADFTVASTDTWLINNKSGSTCTVTLPTASTNSGRTLNFQNYQAQLLVSASSNVVPLGGGSAGTAILLDVAGNWATMVSDGTNWVITQAAPNNIMLV